ncbi:MAG TPA: AAA family ATPase [Candidatus Dormibacteraeota bacterium]|nr:AAA family ATPase [Candidatus Dormibacteraeota bacterium]
MKLRSFRVTNYRCVDDSGEVQVEQIKTIVGKNESGKTSILRALHKFNPAVPEPYNGLKEFPRKRFHEYSDLAPVVEAKFALEEEERDELSKIDARLRDINGVAVTKNFAGEYAVGYLPNMVIPIPTIKGLFPLLIELRGAMDRLDDSAGPQSTVRWKLLDALSRVGTGIEADIDLCPQSSSRDAFVRQVQEVISLLGPNQDSEQYKGIRTIVQLIFDTIDWPSIEARVNKFVVSRLPVFIYFENYAIISSRIHLPSYVERYKRGELSPDEKTAGKLLSFVKLDPERLVELGTTEGKTPDQIKEAIDTRALLVDRATLSLSGFLADNWQQRRNRLDLAIDGDYLRFWVSDEIDGSRIELEQRSKGFQWFLSFYLVFMAESRDGERNAVLLLDEPGLHLHASAQEDLLGVLARLSQRDQVIYATHSPFMINLDALDKVSILTETTHGTKIMEPAKTLDKTALFPVQAALGYSLSKALSNEKYSLLVESVTDLWILSTISQHFKASGRKYIDDDIIITPTGGGQKSALFATMLSGQEMGVAVAVLLDADAEGADVRKKLTETGIARETSVIFVSDVTPDNARVTELEDLMPTSLYLRFVNELYARDVGKNPITDNALTAGIPVRRFVEDEFRKRSLSFSRFRIGRYIMNEFPNIPLSQLPVDFIERMELLFTSINRIKSTAPTQAIAVETVRQSRLRSIFSRSHT